MRLTLRARSWFDRLTASGRRYISPLVLSLSKGKQLWHVLGGQLSKMQEKGANFQRDYVLTKAISYFVLALLFMRVYGLVAQDSKPFFRLVTFSLGIPLPVFSFPAWVYVVLALASLVAAVMLLALVILGRGLDKASGLIGLLSMPFKPLTFASFFAGWLNGVAPLANLGSIWFDFFIWAGIVWIIILLADWAVAIVAMWRRGRAPRFDWARIVGPLWRWLLAQKTLCMMVLAGTILVVSLVILFLSLKGNWLIWLPCGDYFIPLALAYLGVGVLGIVGTWVLIELYYTLMQKVAHLEDRRTRRVLPFSVGIMERLVFTTIGIYLLQGDHPNLGALATILVGYASVKTLLGWGGEGKGQAENTGAQKSIHAFWGTVLSMAFALLGAHLFWIAVKSSCL